jgi:hypothetical protein
MTIIYRSSFHEDIKNALIPIVKAIYWLNNQTSVQENRVTIKKDLKDFFELKRFFSNIFNKVISLNTYYSTNKKISEISITYVSRCSISSLGRYPIINIFSGIYRSLLALVYIIYSILDKIFNKTNNCIAQIKFGIDHFIRGLIEIIPIIGNIYAAYAFKRNIVANKVDINTPPDIRQKQSSQYRLFYNKKEIANSPYNPDFKLPKNLFSLEKHILENDVAKISKLEPTVQQLA